MDDFCFCKVLFNAFAEIRLAKLSDNISVVFGSKYIVDIEYVWDVFKFFEDVDFCVKESAVDLILKKFKINNFDCY